MCLWGAALLLGALGLPAEAFHEAKTAAFLGLALGFSIWFGGLMTAGGQWFASWQSKEWNGREAAFMFYTPIALVFRKRHADAALISMGSDSIDRGCQTKSININGVSLD